MPKINTGYGMELLLWWDTGLIYAAGQKIFESLLEEHELAVIVVARHYNI